MEEADYFATSFLIWVKLQVFNSTTRRSPFSLFYVLVEVNKRSWSTCSLLPDLLVLHSQLLGHTAQTDLGSGWLTWGSESDGFVSPQWGPSCAEQRHRVTGGTMLPHRLWEEKGIKEPSYIYRTELKDTEKDLTVVLMKMPRCVGQYVCLCSVLLSCWRWWMIP